MTHRHLDLPFIFCWYLQKKCRSSNFSRDYIGVFLSKANCIETLSPQSFPTLQIAFGPYNCCRSMDKLDAWLQTFRSKRNPQMKNPYCLYFCMLQQRHLSELHNSSPPRRYNFNKFFSIFLRMSVTHPSRWLNCKASPVIKCIAMG